MSGVSLGNDLSLRAPGELTEYTVATLPDATLFEGYAVYCSNGAAGNPVLAFSNGTNWLRCDTLATAAAS